MYKSFFYKTFLLLSLIYQLAIG